MAVLAVLTTPNTQAAPDSTPRRIVAGFPSIEVEVVQFERDGSLAVIYFWLRGVPVPEVEPVMADDPRITNAERLERTEDAALYKAEWEVDSPVIHCMAGANGMVVQAEGTVEEWRLKIWFENRSDASAFHACCTERDVPLTVDRLSSLADALSNGGADVSPRQREALVLAYREGYFDEPRRVSQEELADELDISSTAVGRRLRRGYANLVEELLID